MALIETELSVAELYEDLLPDVVSSLSSEGFYLYVTQDVFRDGRTDVF